MVPSEAALGTKVGSDVPAGCGDARLDADPLVAGAVFDPPILAEDVPAERVLPAPTLLWQLTGTETGVATAALIDVVVLMVRERPGSAG